MHYLVLRIEYSSRKTKQLINKWLLVLLVLMNIYRHTLHFRIFVDVADISIALKAHHDVNQVFTHWGIRVDVQLHKLGHFVRREPVSALRQNEVVDASHSIRRRLGSWNAEYNSCNLKQNWKFCWPDLVPERHCGWTHCDEMLGFWRRTLHVVKKRSHFEKHVLMRRRESLLRQDEVKQQAEVVVQIVFEHTFACLWRRIQVVGESHGFGVQKCQRSTKICDTSWPSRQTCFNFRNNR